MDKIYARFHFNFSPTRSAQRRKRSFTVPTAAKLAAKLLTDAAVFFRLIADHNPDLRDQMRENATLFEHISALVDDDPLQRFGDDDENTSTAIAAAAAVQTGRDAAAAAAAKTVFRARAAWVSDLHAAEGPDAGDRMLQGLDRDGVSWTRCTREASAEWRGRLAPLAKGDAPMLGPQDLQRLEQSTLWALEPSFFSDATLLHAVHQDPPMDAFFLSYLARRGGNERRLRPLSASIEELHRANAQAPLMIDGAEVDYLYYFMHIVQADEGPFRIVAGPALRHAREVLEAMGQAEVAGRLAPPRLLALTPSGSCIYESDLTYAGGLFQTRLEVHANGSVDMLEDSPVLLEIDALRDRPRTTT